NIISGLCSKTGMKLIRYRLAPEYRNSVRQKRIQAAHPGFGSTVSIRVKMNHLTQCVDPCVRAPRTYRLDGLRQKRRQRGLKSVLNCLATVLCLPALKSGTVVT